MEKQIDADVVNPFLAAVVEVLSTMAHIEARPGKPYLKTDPKAAGQVTGVLSISGVNKGVVAVSFDENCILTIVKGLLNEEHRTFTDQVHDAVGELTNMIAGHARAELGKINKKYHASIPRVIMGEGHEAPHVENDAPVVAIPFETDHGNVTVEVSFSRTITTTREDVFDEKKRH